MHSPLRLSLIPSARKLKPAILLSVFALMGASPSVFGAEPTIGIRAVGTFQPDGPPQPPPVRVDAGTSCVVDVAQGYIVNGTLSGSFDVDYRILVLGPCGRPPGTFDEEWIAWGNFAGTVDGTRASAIFTYTARVTSAGEVSGEIVLGQGLDGDLRVRGSFSDGVLTYEGRVTESESQ
jgi:hypothetical protein